MINQNLLSSAIAPILSAASLWNPLYLIGKISSRQWLVFAAAGFLVTVPVFVQAPLVRMFPVASLLSTLGWLVLSLAMIFRPKTALWGDLLLGFTGTWFAGSIYWGWLRWEPFLHLPVEAIGVPFTVWCLMRSWGKVGSYFYLGSLFGTAVTDLYFYLTGLIRYWRELMKVEPELAMPIFQSAIGQISTPWGVGCAVALIGTLLGVGLVHLRFKDLHWWAFSGAVLSTLLVDGLFWVVASAV
ncbi:MAG TPA: DUF3120 domain-containing protein [Kamptonema sp.]|nr:DUF3120 domain-containing protein [Kamptonema sp.]